MKIIKNKVPSIPHTYVSIDSEWFGLNSKQLHRPTSGRFGCMTVCGDPKFEEVYLISDPDLVAPTLKSLEHNVWIIQNAKFDLTHLRRLAPIPPRSKLVDIMLMERIKYGGYYDLFGLDDLARRYLDIEVDKSLQKSFEIDTVLSPKQEEYAAKDAILNLQVWFEQKKDVSNNDMKIWKEIDGPALWAVLDFMGFRIDVERWRALAELNKQRQEEFDSKLPYNPRSWNKARDYLRRKGFKGLPNCQAATIEKYIEKYPDTKAAEYARYGLQSIEYGTRASRYGMSFITDYLEQESEDVFFVHTDYSVNGAETSRMAARNPAMHQIPSRDTTEFRECFIARPGNKLVIIDYSQQEVGIAAWESQDKKLMEIYNSGQDIYIQMAKLMYGKDIDKHDPLRRRMKSVVLGTNYGLSEFGLARKEGIEVDEAAEILAQFRRTFPGMAHWMDKTQKNKKYVTTASGRKIYLNPYSDQCPRNALNGPMQGGGADQLKKALGRTHREWDENIFGVPYAAVEVTHDEMGFDVPEEVAKAVAKYAETIMKDTANAIYPGMNFRAEAHIADTWAEKD